MSLSKKTIKWINKNAKATLKNKTVLITGANSGVGFKTAETCLYCGANIILACRNISKATNAKNKLLLEYKDANISILELDISSFSSIENFVNNIIENQIDIDVFVNNAGAYCMPNKTTVDGFEYVIGVNYFGTYYLTEKIMNYLLSLKHQVQYINTISLVYKYAEKIDFSNFYYKKKYRNLRVYSRSKLCLAKYSYYIANKLKNTNVKVYLNHPGIALTPLGLNSVGKLAKLKNVLGWLFNSIEKSSLSVLYILNNNFNCGAIVGPNKLFGGWGYPKLNKTKNVLKTDINKLIEFTNTEIQKHI